ncbi:MAG TPA: signal peptide peptidase SppA [Thermodesulfobacteriota bacterium]|nr:signal peptide peptidase SppA [Thermodesulfobacteriota bacterium]
MFLFLALIVGIGIGFMISGGTGFGGLGEKVAVLRVEGVIVDSQDYLESLSTIKKDEDVKALVVRINSPGGAVAPSQEIYASIKELRKKIPVVASIETVGASGGYYIALAAQKIFANPGSITGSIGVIVHFMNYSELLNWAKVDVQTVKSGKFKDIGSPLRELDEAEKQYMQELIDNVHSQFKLVVSKGRGMGLEKVNLIADGRVFTGEQAKELNLVDELGTLDDAIRLAGTLGGIKGEPDVIYYPEQRRGLLNFILSKLEIPEFAGFPLKERFGLFYLTDIMQ